MSSKRKQRHRKRKIEFIVSWILVIILIPSLIGLFFLLERIIRINPKSDIKAVEAYSIQTDNFETEECGSETQPIKVEVRVQVETQDLIPISADDTYISDEIQMLCIEIGNQTGYCPELLVSIIEAESSGEQYAENGPCKGLMQINADWPEISAYMKSHGYTDIYDYETNIRLGCYVLDQKREVYGDDIYAVLMGYNGSSNVIKRLESGDYTDYAVKVADRAWELERIHGK